VATWETKNGSARSAAFAPDGKRVAVPGFWRTQLFDAANGQPANAPNLPALGDGGGFAAAFTPDGRLLITTGPDGTCRIWDLTADPTTLLPSTASPVRDLRALRSGEQLLIASVQFDGEVRIRARSREGQWHDTLRVNVGDRAQTLALSADASQLVVGRADGHIVTLDARTGRVVQDVAAHADAVNAVRLTHDGMTLVSGGSDDVVRVWRRRADGADGAGWDAGAVLPCGGNVINVAVSPDGNTVAATARPGNLHFWDLPTAQARGQVSLAKMPWRLAWSPDGRRIAVGSWDRSVKVFDISPTSQPPARLAAELLGHAQLVLNEAFDQSGELLASVSNDGSLRIWDLSGLANANGDLQYADRRRCLVTLEANAGDSLSVAFVPSLPGSSGTSTAVGYYDGTIRVWDLGYFDRHLKGQLDYQRGLRRAASSR
jgi:WD40 repeat protein